MTDNYGISRGGVYKLVLFECDQLSSLDSFYETINNLISSEDIIVLGDSFSKQGDAGRKAIPANELWEYLRNKYEISKARIDKIRRKNDPTAIVEIKFRVPAINENTGFVSFFEDNNITLSYAAYPNRDDTLAFDYPMSRSRIKKDTVNKSVGEQIMQFYILAAKLLIPALKPAHAWAAEVDEYIPKIVRNYESNQPINLLFWLNYYSSDHFSKSFIELVSKAPVGILSSLENGVWFQISEEFGWRSESSSTGLVNEIYKYFKEAGVEHIIWH